MNTPRQKWWVVGSNLNPDFLFSSVGDEPKNHFWENPTPPKFNIDPEKWWLEDYFPIGKVTFQGLC